MSVIYFVVGNIAAHSGYIAMEDENDIWCNKNPEGWTYQDVTGPHGTILGLYETREEAQKELDKYMECDSVENGTYCYTHNPYV